MPLRDASEAYVVDAFRKATGQIRHFRGDGHNRLTMPTLFAPGVPAMGTPAGDRANVRRVETIRSFLQGRGETVRC